jgi:hypothetical protein
MSGSGESGKSIWLILTEAGRAEVGGVKGKQAVRKPSALYDAREPVPRGNAGSRAGSKQAQLVGMLSRLSGRHGGRGGSRLRERNASQRGLSWLSQLAEWEPLSEDFLAWIDAGDCRVGKLMGPSKDFREASSQLCILLTDTNYNRSLPGRALVAVFQVKEHFGGFQIAFRRLVGQLSQRDLFS